MLYITFSKRKDAKWVYKKLLLTCDEKESDLVVLKGYTILCLNGIKNLSNVLTQFIIDKNELVWMKNIITSYQFSNKKDIERIMQIAVAILNGEKKEIPIQNFQLRDGLIQQELSYVIQKGGHIQFKSNTSELFHTYYSLVKETTVAAIDEFLLQEDYATFVHSLRNYLRKRTSKINRINIVYNCGDYAFYDDQRNHLNELKLKQMTDPLFLNNSHFNIKPFVLGPLLSTKPKQLYIYTDSDHVPLIKTVKDIFEEHVTVEPIYKFFHS
jgi:putative sporulation protein YtxC